MLGIKTPDGSEKKLGKVENVMESGKKEGVGFRNGINKRVN